MSKSSKVLKIAFPAVGEMLLYTLVWVIDTIYIGNYGSAAAVTAVGFSSEIVYTAINIVITIGICIGITTTVANNVGAERFDEAERFLSQGVLFGGVLAFLIALILGIFPKELLLLFGANGEILSLGSKFIRIVSVGAFFNMMCGLLNAGLRGSGNTVVPLGVSLIINIVTIVFGYLLIFGRFGFPELGVEGSAIATTMAYLSGFLILLFYYKRHSRIKIRLVHLKKLYRDCIGRILKLSVPSSFQEAAFSISRLVTLSFIMKLGEVAFAANQITTTIESLSFMPGWGFSVAATALVGQRVGAKDYKTAGKFAYIAAMYGTILMAICSIIFLIIPKQLISVFISNQETIRLGTLCLMIAALEQPFMAVSMVLGGALKGSGDTVSPFIVSLISSWVIRLPLIYVVIFVLKLPVQYVWLITGIQYMFEASILIYIFRRRNKKWEKLKGASV